MQIFVNVTQEISDITLHSKEIQILSSSFETSSGESIEVDEVAYKPKQSTVCSSTCNRPWISDYY
jgi:hypothetical protein